ncbi:YcnI family protein [Thermomonospora umbrina]|uniref:Uncharacterized protein YcnI n=1 Tax=Thermomonospora umbrina TaxID=111806 RepID=A0A3D9SGG7_9ACTN|nr:YcnI family protein [Thermomonospora umbrina]REE94777.1 uncharacterized protein YcnI [Thermomonospora umbrina]
MSPRVLRRVSAITALSAVALAVTAGPALAHVTVNPRTAEQGSWSKVSFRVPNERDDASTTKVVIELPADHPIASVSVRPTPGWTVKADETRLAVPLKVHDGEITTAVTKITWSGGRIGPGEFQEFDVSLGPLPTDTGQLVFKADQTYSGGEVVHWNEEPRADGTEPEHPAPVLELTGPGKPVTTARVTPAAGPSVTVDASDGTARALGGIGLAAGLVGLLLAGLALTRSRRNT